MIRPLEVFVGLRYTRAKRRNHFISFISLTSMLGITIGVCALITVLSVMNGFEKEMRTRILSIAAHATITGMGGWLADWQGMAQRVAGQRGVVGEAPYILSQGMLSHSREVTGALVRGILPKEEATVSDLAEKMIAGHLDDLRSGEFGIIVGKELAWKLGLRIGSKVTLVSPQGQITPAGLLPRLKQFTVVGIFEVGMYEYDSGLALINLNDAARMYRTDGRVSGLRLRLTDIYDAPRLTHQLSQILGDDFRVRNWTQDHANFFRALRTEKVAMFIILLLIVAVAAFNIVSTLVMVVTDKQADIAILRTLGMSPGSIMGVFMVQGTVIGVIGTLLGAVAGIALAQNVETLVPAIEQLFHVKFLPPSVYYISELPSDMRWADVAWITGASFALSMLATIYPAWRASRTQPADALRYE
jgi:lipoprotein-releasing system permease protein